MCSQIPSGQQFTIVTGQVSKKKTNTQQLHTQLDGLDNAKTNYNSYFFFSKLYRVDLFRIWSNMEISVLLCLRQIPTNSASQDAQGWLEDQVRSHGTVLPNLFGPWGRFHGRHFFHGPRVGDGFGMIHSHCVSCALCHSSVGKESA